MSAYWSVAPVILDYALWGWGRDNYKKKYFTYVDMKLYHFKYSNRKAYFFECQNYNLHQSLFFIGTVVTS